MCSTDLPEARALRRFYHHLIATLAVQVALVVVELARDGLSPWALVILLGGALLVATHATLVFQPATPGPDPKEQPCASMTPHP